MGNVLDLMRTATSVARARETVLQAAQQRDERELRRWRCFGKIGDCTVPRILLFVYRETEFRETEALLPEYKKK